MAVMLMLLGPVKRIVNEKDTFAALLEFHHDSHLREKKISLRDTTDASRAPFSS